MAMTEEQWWAEVREDRELGIDLSEWPKRCPFTGGEIDEDGSHACPDDCPHQQSAEFQAKTLACEICGDERLPSDLNSELVCPPCEEREGR
jgi:hypothetical protein